MLASIFVAGGVDALRNPSGRAKAAKPLIDKSQDVLPDEVTQNVPDDPETLVKINAAIQIGGGVLLATGKAPRIASAVLAGSLVPTTLAGHAFWEETDPEAKALQRTQFLKNVSLLGGLLIAAVDTEGKPSVAWRSKRAARNAKVAVAGAIPLASSSDTSDTLASAGHKAKEFAEVAAERVQPYAEVAARPQGHQEAAQGSAQAARAGAQGLQEEVRLGKQGRAEAAPVVAEGRREARPVRARADREHRAPVRLIPGSVSNSVDGRRPPSRRRRPSSCATPVDSSGSRFCLQEAQCRIRPPPRPPANPTA
ncbi:DoxX family protein, partial [Rhodococcoides kroppenstedtii]|uniref:DoxX family protein n=1 Tax=Rhodococcoides kroppenstedtii TaxID=293050 RepID=UPI0035302117